MRSLQAGERVRTIHEDGRVLYEGDGIVVVDLFDGGTVVLPRDEVSTRDELFEDERWPESES